MSAGRSTKHINNSIYRRLQKIRRQLQRAGVATVYKNYQVFRFEPQGSQAIGGFNIAFSFIHASNGESAGSPVIKIHGALQGDFTYGGWKNINGTFEQGIAKLIEIFAEPNLISVGVS